VLRAIGLVVLVQQKHPSPRPRVKRSPRHRPVSSAPSLGNSDRQRRLDRARSRASAGRVRAATGRSRSSTATRDSSSRATRYSAARRGGSCLPLA